MQINSPPVWNSIGTSWLSWLHVMSPGVYEALKELAGIVKVENETVITLYRYATVAMQHLGDDIDTIVAKLQVRNWRWFELVFDSCF